MIGIASGNSAPAVLVPFDRHEALTVRQAANISGRTLITVRRWAAMYDIGRVVGGRWLISKLALAMFLDGDDEALAAYLHGDRESALVRSYIDRWKSEKNLDQKEQTEHSEQSDLGRR